jgi:two-component system sensor histidine kinase PilS (NtrC family)
MDFFEKDIQQSKLVLKRFAAARAGLILIVGLLFVAMQASGGNALDISSTYLYIIFFIAVVESLIVSAVLGTAFKPTVRFSFFLLLADLVLISAIVSLSGGGRSAFAFLYIAAIMSASILLSFSWSILVATIASGLFVLIVVVEHMGMISPASPFSGMGPPMSPDEIWAYSAMKILAFYLTAFLSGYLSNRIGTLQSIQHNILNSFSSGFISLDRDLKVTFFNSAAAALLRRPRSGCIGQDVSTIFPTDNDEANPLRDAIVNAKECQGKEMLVSRGDGVQIPIGITASMLKDQNGRPTGSMASFVDLTEMKRMEDKLRRADRLAAIGEMSASLAHEIRNPVAAIRGSVQEMSENLELIGTNARLMDIVIKESDQLSKIISSFLKFVNINTIEKAPFEVSEVLEDAVRTVQEQCARNGHIHFEIECPDSVDRVMGERLQIREVLVNLIQNSIDAMPAGGILRAWIDEVEDPAAQVSIHIRDSGAGIPEAELKKVFDPFYTTKPQGIGLGMAIAHKVITGHGGSIDLESVEGDGTMVTIELPRGV